MSETDFLIGLAHGWQAELVDRPTTDYLVMDWQTLRSLEYALQPPQTLKEFLGIKKVGITQHPVQLTPLSQLVPWLLAGLRDAVATGLAAEILLIIEIVKESGHQDQELDIIENSLRSEVVEDRRAEFARRAFTFPRAF